MLTTCPSLLEHLVRTCAVARVPVKLLLLGVRGSTPAPGAAFIRYGGHTSCVAVVADGADVPTLVLDAGTGLRAVTAQLRGDPYRGSILLSHLHWDHAQGLPFFAGGDRDDAVVDLFCPAQDELGGRDLLARLMSPPIFPIEPEGLKGQWSFHALDAGSFVASGFRITGFDVPHKGGRTFGYRVADERSSVVYLPDHAPAHAQLGQPGDVMSAIGGADVLIHDAQFVAAERRVADAYGHATIDDAIDLALAAGVRMLVLFHHGPGRTDDQLDTIMDALAPPPRLHVVAAREGDTIEVPRRR